VSLFVTGTDTDVGKTDIAARLLHLLRASGIRWAGMKPICHGDRRDAETLLAAGSDCVTIDEVNPVWLKTPAAPIVGTLMEKVTIDIEQILTAFHVLQERVEHVVGEENRPLAGADSFRLLCERFGRVDEVAGSCGRAKPAGLS
jgi:dethiobiotin synthetase